MPTPAAFIFDLFGVVIDFDDTLVYKRLAKYCNRPDHAEQEMEDLVSCHDLITGKLSITELRETLERQFGLSLTEAEFSRLWRLPYSEDVPGMENLLKFLSHEGELLLLSNVDKYYWETVQAHHNSIKCFGKKVLSWQAGLAKPDKRIFDLAAASVGIAPSQSFFVDDKKENVEAARALGFQAHQYVGMPQLMAALHGIGVVGDLK